jgi:hypothetical protein
VKDIIFGAAFLSLGALLMFGPVGRDDTDPPSGRSGMGLYTDSLTGCQYLSHAFSGLTPRMDSAGHQVCRKTTP